MLIEGSRMSPTSSAVPSTGTITNGGTKNTSSSSSHSGMIRVRRPALDPSDILVTSTALKNSEEKQGGGTRGGGGGGGPGSNTIDSHSQIRNYQREEKEQPSSSLSSQQQQNDEEKDHQQQEQNTSQNGSFVGSSEYVSPEILRNHPASPGSDMWALGCIIYKLFTGIAMIRHILSILQLTYCIRLCQYTLSKHPIHIS